MIYLFRYNWQVREEWFHLCEQISHEELMASRTGGLGSISKTLFHVVDIEQSWINGLCGKPEYHHEYSDYSSLNEIKKLSAQCRPSIEKVILGWNPEKDTQLIFGFTYGEVIRHIIAHEIHHIGQLSIWARELGIEPVSANLILRGLYNE
ncbi:DinB family protein [Bacillus sp. FSL K6-3431]|uniref:DinB family protein n=1 Tax=Bacillus sp. FSL K6-3431 TaxID=2921500 RepID=UPI0030F61AA4